MKFFVYIHRSVTDPTFYGEILSLKRRTVVGYLVLLFLIAAFVGSATHTSRIIDPEKGISPALGGLFKGMSFEDGKLVNPGENPRVADPILLGHLLRVLQAPFDISFGTLPDSVMVVDTRFTVAEIDSTQAIYRICSDGVVVKGIDSSPVRVAFGAGGSTDGKPVYLTTERMQKFLSRNVVLIFLIMSFVHLVIGMGEAIPVMFIISFASYIFVTRRRLLLRKLLRLSFFAITPVPLAATIEALAGVQNAWLMHGANLAATIILVRGIRFVLTPQSPEPGKELF